MKRVLSSSQTFEINAIYICQTLKYLSGLPIVSNSWVRDGPSGRTQHHPQDELCPHLWSVCNNRYTYTCIACTWGEEMRVRVGVGCQHHMHEHIKISDFHII